MPQIHSVFPDTNTLCLEDTELAAREPEEALDRAAIADLSSYQISGMTDAELTRIVRAAGLPATTVHHAYLDRGTLERLAHLARLACRNRR
jgi:hypothetical protein